VVQLANEAVFTELIEELFDFAHANAMKHGTHGE